MPKFLVTHTPETVTEQYVIKANSEEEALDKWGDDHFISKRVIKHGDGYLHVEEIEEASE